MPARQVRGWSSSLLPAREPPLAPRSNPPPRQFNNSWFHLDTTGAPGVAYTVAVPPAYSEPMITDAPPQILVVDDEPNLRRVLGAQLSRDGYEVHAAEDGEAALRILIASTTSTW